MCSKCVHNRPSQKDGAPPCHVLGGGALRFFLKNFSKFSDKSPYFPDTPTEAKPPRALIFQAFLPPPKPPRSVLAVWRSGVRIPYTPPNKEALFFKGFRTLRSKAFFVLFSDFLKYFSNTPRKQARGVPLFCQKPRRNYSNISPTFSAAARSFCSSKCPYMSSVVEVRECPSRREVMRISPPPRSKRLA